MHIVHVITRLLQAGSEENTIATCLDHVSRGHRVTLVHGAEYDEVWYSRLAGKVELHRIGSLIHPIHLAKDFVAVAQVAALLRELRPDLVHTHQSKGGIVGRLAAAVAGVPAIVHTVHIAPFDNVNGGRRRLYVTAERFCARFTDVIITVSASMRELFIAAGISHSVRYEVIQSGMDLDRFASAHATPHWRKRLNGWHSRKRPKIILMLAAFEPRKRQRELIHALAPELRNRSDICLVFAGAGPLMGSCRHDARVLGVDSQIKFLGHDPSPEQLIALAEICVLTSIREGLPRSVVQYLAAGKPVLVSPIPGIEDLIISGVNGVIAPSEELGPLVTELFSLLSDERRLKLLSSGAQATDLSNWREELMGARIEAVYLDALKKRRAVA